MPTLRRRWTYCIILLILVPTILIQYYSSYLFEPPLQEHPVYANRDNDHHTSLNANKVEDQDLNSDSTSDVIVATLCELDKCMRGRWIPREPPFRSIADFRRRYPVTHRGIFKTCGSEENKREQGDRERFREAQEERLVQAANWVWKPMKGRMMDWDAISFVVRLLRSPGGLIFSGDSITRQHFQWLEYALAAADIRITEDPSYLPFYSHKRLHQFILKPGDPMTDYLQDRAGVPDSRLKRPIYTKIDNHILIGEKEVREFSASLGAKDGFIWYDIFDYFEGWESFVRDAAKVREGESNVIEDTILVLNTGAHWARSAWYMLPKTGDVLEQQSRVTVAFKKMVQLITSRLDPIPHLSIYYRATAPGHPACTSSAFYQTFLVNSTLIAPPSDDSEQAKLFTESSTFYTVPHSNASVAQESMSTIQQSLVQSTFDKQQKVARSRWDWDRFVVHNAEWKQVIDDINSRGTASSEKARWYFMDIWEMALQRPDAHTQNLVDPPREIYDCLHWCVPGVVEQWMQYLNHLVFWNKDSRPS